MGPYSLGAGAARTPGPSPGTLMSPYARTPGAFGTPGPATGGFRGAAGTPLGGGRGGTPLALGMPLSSGGGGLALRGRAAKYAEVVRKVNQAEASRQTFEAVKEFAAACATDDASGGLRACFCIKGTGH